MSRPGTSMRVATATPHATPQWGLSVISDGDGDAVRRDRHGEQPPPTFSEIHKYRSPSRATRTEESAQPQPHQPAHCFVVQQQRTTSVSVIHSWDQRVLRPQGLEAVNTAAIAAAIASGPVREWMPKPRMSPWCPPGLECLAVLGRLTFFDLMLEIPLGENDRIPGSIRGRHLPRRFQVLNSEGQQVFCVDIRASSVASHFETVFFDRYGEVLITIKIKTVCCPTGCCAIANNSSCTVDATVEAPPGHAVGSVTQRYSRCGRASFVVQIADGTSFRLEGSNPCCYYPGKTTNKLLPPYGNFSVNFYLRLLSLYRCLHLAVPAGAGSCKQNTRIYSLDHEQVIGKIEAQETLITPYSWRLLTNFALSFPADLDVRTKATLSGAATVLHYYYYGNRFLNLEESN